jgi:hypothetical protein
MMCHLATIEQTVDIGSTQASQKKPLLHKGSPEFKSKDNPLITKPVGLTKVRSKTKLSSSAKEFVLPRSVTNENISNNTDEESGKNVSELTNKHESDTDSKISTKIKLSKESRPFTKAAEDLAKPTLSTKSKLFNVKNMKTQS